jgi:hypothetical protein
MSIVGYQSNVIIKTQGGGLIANTQRELSVPSNQLNADMLHSPGRNIYAVINENIVIGKDIRLRSRSGRKEIAGWQLSLPAPINKNQQGEHTGTLLSRQGEPFYYAIDDDGRVFVSGALKDPEDEIIFNINPYVAELPLKFRPFSGGTFVLPPSDDFDVEEIQPVAPVRVRRAR